VRSGENADLASGYANVVVLSPFGGRIRTPPERGMDPAGQFEGLRKFPGADLASQVEALRKQGSHVEVISQLGPDSASRHRGPGWPGVGGGQQVTAQIARAPM
jgi:NTE family protein